LFDHGPRRSFAKGGVRRREKERSSFRACSSFFLPPRRKGGKKRLGGKKHFAPARSTAAPEKKKKVQKGSCALTIYTKERGKRRKEKEGTRHSEPNNRHSKKNENIVGIYDLKVYWAKAEKKIRRVEEGHGSRGPTLTCGEKKRGERHRTVSSHAQS